MTEEQMPRPKRNPSEVIRKALATAATTEHPEIDESQVSYMDIVDGNGNNRLVALSGHAPVIEEELLPYEDGEL